MKTLLLRLVGPMQSWGTQSRYSIRDTNLEPSKSGVIGLIYSALGKKRAENSQKEQNGKKFHGQTLFGETGQRSKNFAFERQAERGWLAKK